MTAAHPQAPASPQPEAEAQEAVADERYLQLERTLEFTKAELDVYRSTFGQRDTGIVPSTGAVKLTDEQHTLAHKVKVLAEIALGRGTKLPLHTRRKNLCAAIDELAALATPSAGAPLPEQRQEAAQVEADDFVGKRLRLVCKLAGVPIPDGDDKQIADCAFVLLGMIRAALERANAALGAAVGLTIAEIADPKHGSPASLATPPASSRVAAPTMQAVKVPLTDEQIQDAWAASSDPDCAEISIFDFATAIQRACAEAWGIQLSEGERSHD